MAEVETAQGDGTFERAFLESIYKRDPDDPRVLTLLATLYTEIGEVEKGLALDRHHVELTPDDPSARYDFACSLSLSGCLDAAFDEMERALELGFDGFDWMQQDPDLGPMREDPRWAELMEKHHIPASPLKALSEEIGEPEETDET